MAQRHQIEVRDEAVVKSDGHAGVSGNVDLLGLVQIFHHCSLLDLIVASRTRIGLDRRGYDIAKELENLARLRVTTCCTLGEQQLAIDGHVEDTACSGDQRQLADDVLVVMEEVPRRAHGTVGIVSRHAVGDADSMLFHRCRPYPVRRG